MSSGLTCDRKTNYSGLRALSPRSYLRSSLLQGAIERKCVRPSLAFVHYISKNPRLLTVLPACVLGVGEPAAAGSLLCALQ